MSQEIQIIPIEEDILYKIGSIADKNEIELYAVGGYVRDYYLNRERTDIDFTVVGDSISFAKILAKEFSSKAVVYPKFQTAMVPVGNLILEFVGTRKEVYESDSRKPIVSQGTFEDDIMRRDFTINAMAVSLNKDTLGHIIDMFDGMKDLEAKLLRTPLEPKKTYSDDPLRMMRAARFASQLNFDLEAQTFDAISEMNDRINIISQERITDEFFKIMASPKPSIGLSILYDSGLMKHVFPEVDSLSGVEIMEEESRTYSHKDVLRHSFKVVDNISIMTDNVWLRFAALVHDIAKPLTKRFSKTQGWTFHGHEEIGARWMKRIFKRMKFPMERLSYVEKLVRLHQRPMVLVDDGVTDSAVRRLAVVAGEDLEDLFTLCRADITTKNPKLSDKYRNNYERVFQKVIEVQEKDKLRAFQSPVRGEEIMEICDIKPSRLVGYIKTQIEEAILEGYIPNEYEDAKSYFLQNKDIWIEEFSRNQ